VSCDAWNPSRRSGRTSVSWADVSDDSANGQQTAWLSQQRLRRRPMSVWDYSWPVAAAMISANKGDMQLASAERRTSRENFFWHSVGSGESRS